MVYRYKSPTLNVTQDAYSLAVGIRDLASKSVSLEAQARKHVSPELAQILFREEVGVSDTQRLHTLTGIAGVCLALASELAKGGADADK